MEQENKRQYQRFESLNLISYVCYDEQDEIVTQGMGRTLNVSETGILLETHTSIAPEYKVSLAIGLEDNLLNVQGRAVYSKAGEGGKFETGIQFVASEDFDLEVLAGYIRSFE